MKLISKWMLAASVLLGLGLSACSQSEGGEQVEEGKPTSMSLTISFPKSQTKATSDLNATEDEMAIKTVDVFIFTGSGAFLSHTPLTDADFGSPSAGTNADTYTATTKINTTTGEKNIHVGINLPAAVVASVKSTPMSQLITKVETFTRAQLESPATTGLPMFSMAPTHIVLNQDETQNNASVDVQRLVAKVTVSMKSPLDESGGNPGILGDISFAINNVNSKMFLIQGAAPTFSDPNWDDAEYDPTHFLPAVDADYVAVYDEANGATPAITDLNAKYASENTCKLKRKKELTRATIRATFIPKIIYTAYDPATEILTQSAADYDGRTQPETFYAVTDPDTGAIACFFDSNVANDYADGIGSDVVTYRNGWCYWHMFLNKPTNGANQWDVMRNDYYRCRITRIVAPGRPRARVEKDEENDTPAVDTKLNVEVDVLYWNAVDVADYELIP